MDLDIVDGVVAVLMALVALMVMIAVLPRRTATKEVERSIQRYRRHHVAAHLHRTKQRRGERAA